MFFVESLSIDSAVYFEMSVRLDLFLSLYLSSLPPNGSCTCKQHAGLVALTGETVRVDRSTGQHAGWSNLLGQLRWSVQSVPCFQRATLYHLVSTILVSNLLKPDG